MDFLSLYIVIIEKCEVKDIEIDQIMTMATRVDILENYFTNGQQNIFVFQPVYFKFWTQEGSISGPSVFYKIEASIFI